MTDGWDDDDDLGLLDDSTSGHHRNRDDNEGWGDDDDLELSETERENDAEGEEQQTTIHVPAPPVVASQEDTIVTPPVHHHDTVLSSSKMPPENGWGEDEDDFFDSEEEEDDEITAPPVSAAAETRLDDSQQTTLVSNTKEDTAERPSAEGWGDEDDLFDEEDDTFTATLHPPLRSSQQQQLQQELAHYIQTLPAHAQSVQAVLTAEYNTTEKAIELQTYYAERPQLVQYTIEKELSRMDYTIVTDNGDVITDKTVIAQIFGHHANNNNNNTTSLAPRCANQSLLADVLTVLTGPDRVVRPQYMATAIASSCRFHVQLLTDDEESSSSTTQVVANLQVSLPTPTGRWTIAHVQVMAVLQMSNKRSTSCTDNQLPSVTFRLADIVPVPLDMAQLQACAALLDELSLDDNNNFNDPPLQQQPGQNFRDVFLQSQGRLQASATEAMVGMQSAWNDLDAATGLGKKLRNILPDTDTLAEAEAAQQFHQQQGQQQQRPTSILGGFVRSLAKSVALPAEDVSLYDQQEEEPQSAFPRLYNHSAVYQQQQQQQQQQQLDSSFPRREEPTPFPRLYSSGNNEAAPHQQPQQQDSSFPRLYHNSNLQPAATNATVEQIPKQKSSVQKQAQEDEPAFPKLYNTSATAEPVSVDNRDSLGALQADEDGWDEDSVLADIPDDNIAAASGESAQPPFVYDPTTDIVPTRKRWIHPNPHARRSLFAS